MIETARSKRSPVVFGIMVNLNDGD
jgi:hypothetical protein